MKVLKFLVFIIAIFSVLSMKMTKTHTHSKKKAHKTKSKKSKKCPCNSNNNVYSPAPSIYPSSFRLYGY